MPLLFRGGAVGSILEYGILAAPKQCSGRLMRSPNHCLATEYSRETVPRPHPSKRSNQCHRQIVRFAAPQTADEQTERFEVLEDRGPRLLVQLVCHLTIKPTFVYLASDLIAVSQQSTAVEAATWRSMSM